MLRCVIIDSVSNAITHGGGDTKLEYWVEQGRVETPRRDLLNVLITNLAKPGSKSLTEERVALLIQRQSTDPMADQHSTGIGLGSATYSMRALRGDVKLTQDGERVSCLLTLPVVAADSAGGENTSTFMRDVEIDSPPYMGTELSGTDSADMLNANEAAYAAPPDQPPPLRIATLDDSPTITRMYGSTLHRLFNIPKDNVRALGIDVEHARNAVTLLLATSPDIIILDQMLDYTNSAGMCFYGTDVATDLRATGYEGFICLCTAGARDMACPATVDLLIDKLGLPVTVAAIKAAFRPSPAGIAMY